MANATAQADRRKFPRISTNFSLEVAPSPTGVGEGMNVSQGGVQFSHKGKVDVGQVLSLTLRVNGFSGTVNVNGKVLRCEPAGTDGYYSVSINFVGVDSDTEKSIIEMINSF